MPRPSTFVSWTSVRLAVCRWWGPTSSSLSRTSTWSLCSHRRRGLHSKVRPRTWVLVGLFVCLLVCLFVLFVASILLSNYAVYKLVFQYYYLIMCFLILLSIG